MMWLDYFGRHGLEEQVYVVRRIGGVVRTVIVGGFALASGFSGVTAVGLAGLAGRVAWERVFGEFQEREGAGKDG